MVRRETICPRSPKLMGAIEKEDISNIVINMGMGKGVDDLLERTKVGEAEGKMMTESSASEDSGANLEGERRGAHAASVRDCSKEHGKPSELLIRSVPLEICWTSLPLIDGDQNYISHEIAKDDFSISSKGVPLDRDGEGGQEEVSMRQDNIEVSPRCEVLAKETTAEDPTKSNPQWESKTNSVAKKTTKKAAAPPMVPTRKSVRKLVTSVSQ